MEKLKKVRWYSKFLPLTTTSNRKEKLLLVLVIIQLIKSYWHLLQLRNIPRGSQMLVVTLIVKLPGREEGRIGKENLVCMLVRIHLISCSSSFLISICPSSVPSYQEKPKKIKWFLTHKVSNRTANPAHMIHLFPKRSALQHKSNSDKNSIALPYSSGIHQCHFPN